MKADNKEKGSYGWHCENRIQEANLDCEGRMLGQDVNRTKNMCTSRNRNIPSETLSFENGKNKLDGRLIIIPTDRFPVDKDVVNFLNIKAKTHNGQLMFALVKCTGTLSPLGPTLRLRSSRSTLTSFSTKPDIESRSATLASGEPLPSHHPSLLLSAQFSTIL